MATETQGLDLRAARVRRGISALQLATQLGVSGERVRQVERQSRPSEHDVARYVSALLALEIHHSERDLFQLTRRQQPLALA